MHSLTEVEKRRKIWFGRLIQHQLSVTDFYSHISCFHSMNRMYSLFILRSTDFVIQKPACTAIVSVPYHGGGRRK